MKVSTIKSTWLPKGGFRLDCSPYLGGAIETEILLEELPVRKDSLGSVTKAIYHAGRESRQWVQDSDYGIPFIGSSDIQKADLSDLHLIAKSQVAKNSQFLIHKGFTLITRSGTIGKMAYCRPEMDGMACSEHVLRIVPDDLKISSGYLYAFLSSRFGVPLVVSGTYGLIIQSIEPAHIRGLSVPRFGDVIEQEIHELIQESARLLDDSGKLLGQATRAFFDGVGLEDISPFTWQESRSMDLGFKVTTDIAHSFRSLGYAPRVQRLIASIKEKNWKSLGEICSPGILARGSRFNRIDADEEFGSKMVGQRDLFSLKPEGRMIATSTLPLDAFVEDGTILVAARGTLGEKELYCRAQFITGPWLNFAYSEDILKIQAAEDKILRGCLFAFFRSETAFRMLRSTSSGTKLQDHNYCLLPKIPVPIPSCIIQSEVDLMVRDAYKRMHQGIALEGQAVTLVENAILNT